jgi:hypothetical protein
MLIIQRDEIEKQLLEREKEGINRKRKGKGKEYIVRAKEVICLLQRKEKTAFENTINECYEKSFKEKA